MTYLNPIQSKVLFPLKRNLTVCASRILTKNDGIVCWDVVMNKIAYSTCIGFIDVGSIDSDNFTEKKLLLRTSMYMYDCDLYQSYPTCVGFVCLY